MLALLLIGELKMVTQIKNITRGILKDIVQITHCPIERRHPVLLFQKRTGKSCDIKYYIEAS